MNYERKLLASLIILLIFLCLFSSKTEAKNDYLGNSRSSCERGSIEFYTELGNSDGQSMTDYSTSSSSDYKNYNDSVNGTVGIRFRWPLQSTCNDDTIQLLQENNRLRQELELLSVCAKYKELELGEDFATVREMCKGVNKIKKNKKEKKIKQNKRKPNLTVPLI